MIVDLVQYWMENSTSDTNLTTHTDPKWVDDRYVLAVLQDYRKDPIFQS